MNSKKLWMYFAAGLSLGLGLGFGIGVLEAPDSGERTRRKFLKKADRLKNSVAKSVSKSKKSHNGVSA